MWGKEERETEGEKTCEGDKRKGMTDRERSINVWLTCWVFTSLAGYNLEFPWRNLTGSSYVVPLPWKHDTFIFSSQRKKYFIYLLLQNPLCNGSSWNDFQAIGLFCSAWNLIMSKIAVIYFPSSKQIKTDLSFQKQLLFFCDNTFWGKKAQLWETALSFFPTSLRFPITC